jgi:AraC-like DNA-binding protein
MTQPPLDRVEHACAELARTGQPVTFTAVGHRAGLARATLYRNAQIRAVIDEHRARQTEGRTQSGLAAEISHLRTALEAIAGNVRQHEERLRRLERAKKNPRNDHED